jgi:single-strand DNA-binding protein
MAKSVNKVILLGNVGKDPEIRSTAGGTMVANLTLATSDRFQDAQGNWQDRTEWHNAGRLQAHRGDHSRLREEGLQAVHRGQAPTRSWDDKESGQKRYKTEIVVFDLSLLSGRDEGASGGSGGYSKAASSASSSASFDQRPPAAAGAPDDYAQSAEISDDDIPF